MKTTAVLLTMGLWAFGASADQPNTAPQAVRTIFEKHDQSGVPGKQIYIGSATLPPGSTIAFHTHPGDEAGYIVKGTVTWKVKGQPDRTLKAGDAFFNPRGSAHSLTVAPGAEPALAVSSWIVDKDAPLATPAP